MADRKQLIVITDPRDAHVPFVQKHLDQPLIIVNPRTIISDGKLTFNFKDGRTQVRYGDVDLNNVGAVWYRKPRTVTRDMVQLADEFTGYALDALHQHIKMLFTAFEDALWVSDVFAIHRASDKKLQLAVASQLGFNVPDAIFTSDEAAARQFIAEHETTIMKSLVPFVSDVDGVHKYLYATKITRKTMPALDTLNFSPAIFQSAVDAVCDIRVTVVGHQVFAAKIIQSGAANPEVRDWRIGHYQGELRIEPFDNFPADIAAQCVKLIAKLDLHFGAIDLVMDAQGVFWFLENNPNGQWAFVEKETGQPIGKALAELLTNGV